MRHHQNATMVVQLRLYLCLFRRLIEPHSMGSFRMRVCTMSQRQHTSTVLTDIPWTMRAATQTNTLDMSPTDRPTHLSKDRQRLFLAAARQLVKFSRNTRSRGKAWGRHHKHPLW
jgi:hypothetical protein